MQLRDIRVQIRHAVLILGSGGICSILLALALPGGYDLIPQADNYSRMTVKISAEEARHKKNTGALVIDARDTKHFAAERIPGAVSIPWDSRAFETISAHRTIIKAAPEIVIYDSPEHSVNLLEMAEYFHTLGYPHHVYVLRNGLNYWKINGYETETR